ncbi:hypothetical protein [Mycolicibacterium sp. A43C]
MSRSFAPEARRGRVARVLNANRLVINRGGQHGVKLGWVYAVLRPESEKIVDPVTNEVLGEVDLEKIRVRITEVQEKLSIASPYRKVMTGMDIFGPSKEVTEKIDVSDIPIVDRTVYTGDPVKLVEAD